MSDSQPTSQQNFYDRVNAPHSQIGCIIYTDKNFQTLLSDVVTEVRETIIKSFLHDELVRQALLTQLNTIEPRIKENTGSFETLITQISCQENLKQDVAYQFIFFIISFFVSAGYHEPTSPLLEPPCLNSKIKDEDCWLFSAAKSAHLGLEHHVGAISDYLASNPNSGISKGNCYIFKLLSDCNTCNNGILSQENNGERILSDFVARSMTNNQKNADFFCIERERTLVFRCGECLCNVSRIIESGEVL